MHVIGSGELCKEAAIRPERYRAAYESVLNKMRNATPHSPEYFKWSGVESNFARKDCDDFLEAAYRNSVKNNTRLVDEEAKLRKGLENRELWNTNRDRTMRLKNLRENRPVRFGFNTLV